jgi:hypothetical protein
VIWWPSKLSKETGELEPQPDLVRQGPLVDD